MELAKPIDKTTQAVLLAKKKQTAGLSA